MNTSAMKYSTVLQLNAIAGDVGRIVHQGEVAVLKRSKGRKIACTSGKLWITVQGDDQDHVLEAEQSLLLSTAGRILVSGLGETAAFRLA